MILIIGRTGTGKDYLARELCKQGLSAVCSYTTRPPRFSGEATHLFISPEEAGRITDKVAVTNINGYEYFATAEQMKGCDIYIIDPNGTSELLKNCPDVKFDICYLQSDESVRRTKAVARGSDIERETAVYDARNEAENAQFRAFENMINDPYALNAFKTSHPNVRRVLIGRNDYTPEAITGIVDTLISSEERRIS